MQKNKLNKIVSLILMGCFLFCTLFCACNNPTKTIYKELGIASAQQFTEVGEPSRCVYDMKIWQNKLYIGSGDYDKNTGPANIFCYDLQTKQWQTENLFQTTDEAVVRFLELNGKLVVPGVDSCGEEGWDWGNYYTFNDGENNWTKSTNIPNGIHNFDMLIFEDKIYAGIGVDNKNFPMVVSTDGGQTFQHVEMLKNGQSYIADSTQDMYFRVYELMNYNQNLYALTVRTEKIIHTDENEQEIVEEKNYLSLFRLQDGKMHYFGTLTGVDEYMLINTNVFSAKGEFDNKYYFTTGKLYCTSDMQSFDKIDIDSSVVSDFIIDGQNLYALCYKKINDKTFRNSVYKLSKDTIQKEKLFEFDYNTPAMSLEKQDNVWFLGMGNLKEKNQNNGMVLSIEL